MAVRGVTKMLVKRYGSRCMIALQEIQRWPHGDACPPLAAGFRLIHSAGAPCGFLIPPGVQNILKSDAVHFVGSSCAMVVNDYGVVASYLPDTSKSMEICWEEIANAIECFANMGEDKHTIWGI